MEFVLNLTPQELLIYFGYLLLSIGIVYGPGWLLNRYRAGTKIEQQYQADMKKTKQNTKKDVSKKKNQLKKTEIQILPHKDRDK